MNLKLFEGWICVICYIKVAISLDTGCLENEARLKSLQVVFQDNMEQNLFSTLMN